MRKLNRKGYLYLVRSEDYIKIGYTDDWTEREKAYKTHNPGLELLDLIEGTQEDEVELHTELKDLLLGTEWMRLNPRVADSWLKFKEKTGQLKMPHLYHREKKDKITDDKWIKVPLALRDCDHENVHRYIQYIDQEMEEGDIFWHYKASGKPKELLFLTFNGQIDYLGEERRIKEGTKQVRIVETYKYNPKEYFTINHKILTWPMYHEVIGKIIQISIALQEDKIPRGEWKDFYLEYLRPYGIDMMLYLYKEEILKIDKYIYLKPFKNIKYGNDTLSIID